MMQRGQARCFRGKPAIVARNGRCIVTASGVLDLGTRDNSIDGGKRVLRLKMGQESAQWAWKATEIRSERTVFEALESGSTLGVVAEGLQSIQGGTCIVAF